MKLSPEAVAVIMLLLQKGIADQVDMTEEFLNLNFEYDQDREALICTNPPKVEIEAFKNLE